MKKRLLAVLVLIVFLFSQFAILADAKGSSGGRSSGGRSGGYSGSSKSSVSSGRSYGGSSYSKGSSGSSSSGSSSSKSSGYSGSNSSGSSSSKSSGYSGSSSSRSVPDSYSGKSSSSSSSAKSATMSNAYNKQMSSSNYKAYQQKLDSNQQKAYQNSYNRNYQYNRMSFDDSLRTRPQRITVINNRPVYVNVNTSMFGGPISYGSAYIGIWDMWFLMRASDLFWYHHWNDIYPYRNYFQAQQFADMERRVRNLEMQNMQRDPNYLDPGVDPDLQFSNDYVQKNLNKVYYQKNTGNPFVTFLIIVVIIVILILILRRFSRPKKGKSFDSRIY